MVDTEITLPAIDMGKARDPDLRREVARQLVHALETVGFVFIENVVGFEPHTLLDKARWFFSLPDAQKQEVARKLWNPLSKNHYRGYFPLQEGEVSYKEGYEIGREVPENTQHMPDDLQVHPFFQEPNMWPGSAEGGEQFRTQLLTHYNAALQCGAEVLRLVSLGSGLKDDWFQSLFFPNSLSTLRLLHYPPRPGVVSPTARDGETVLCCSDHSDSGFVTLLATFHYKGLQIWQEENGRWMDVPCRPNSLVMNIGDMLSAMSGGRFKATRHRVVDTGVDRYSIPFFFEPNYRADITRVMPWPEEESLPVQSEQVVANKHYGPWLIEKMRSFAEYREILDSFTSTIRA